MRKKINGTSYNTDTSELLFTSEWNTTIYFTGKLYRTKRGRYFLHITGEPIGTACHDLNYTSKEFIAPIREEEARRLIAEKSEVETSLDSWGQPE